MLEEREEEVRLEWEIAVRHLNEERLAYPHLAGEAPLVDSLHDALDERVGEGHVEGLVRELREVARVTLRAVRLGEREGPEVDVQRRDA